MSETAEFILQLKSSTPIQIIGVIFVIFSSTLTAVGLVEAVKKYVYEPLSYRQTQYDNLKILSTEAHINYFKNKLGDPAFINAESDKGLKEYIFVNKLYYVQAITDRTDKVLGYSVTTRDKKFNPKVPFFDQDVWLGKTPFLTLGPDRNPDWIISALGAHDLFYSEGYYQANPGGYQTVFLSNTMSGYANYDSNYDENSEQEYFVPPNYVSPSLDLDFKNLEGEEERPEEVLAFIRNNTDVVNTYTVLGRFISAKDLIEIRGSVMYLFGPDHNQARLLPDY